MRTKTKAFSYLLACLMLFSCIFSTGLLSQTAFATDGGIGGFGGWQTGGEFKAPAENDIVYAVFPVFIDGFGDGDAVSASDMTAVCKRLKTDNNDFFAYYTSCVIFEPTLESGQKHHFYCLAATSGKDRGSDLCVYTAQCRKQSFSPKDYGDWAEVFSNGGYFTPNGISNAVPKWEEYQQSHSVKEELDNLVLPYCDALEDNGCTAAAERIRTELAQNKPVTFIVEPMIFEYYGADDTILYASAFQLNKLSTSNNMMMPGYTGTVDKGSIWWGFYYNYGRLVGKSNIEGNGIPAYYAQYKPARDAQSTFRLYDTCGLTGGWGYFTLCNGDYSTGINFNINKKPEVTAKGGADAAKFAEGVEATYTVYGVPETDLINSFASTVPTPVEVTDKSAKGILSAIDSVYTLSVGNVKTLFSNAVNAADTKEYGSRSTSTATSGQSASISIDVPSVKEPWYFCVYESACSSSCYDYNIASTPDPSCIVLKYEPKLNDAGEVVDATWSFVDLKGYDTSLPDNTCTFKVNGTTVDSVDLTATNPFEITGEPTADVNAPNVTVLDVDDYWVVDYKSDYAGNGAIKSDLRQKIYTRSTLVNPDGAAFIPAIAFSDTVTALSNSASKIEQAAEDDNVKTLNVPKDNASYTQGNVTGIDGTLDFSLQPNAKKSFTVNKDYIRDYGSVRDDPSSVGSAYTSFITSAETDQGTVTIPFTGGETFSIGTNTTSWNDYVDYAENYALYEAALAASAGEVQSALSYWSAEAVDLVAQMNSIYSSIPSENSNRTYSAVKSALDKIAPLAEKLHEITGWTVKYGSCYWERCPNYCSSGRLPHSRCGGSGHYYCSSEYCHGHKCAETVDCGGCSYGGHRVCGGYNAHYLGNNSNKDGIKITSSGGISSGAAPKAIKVLFGGSNPGSITSGSLLGKLSDINVNQLKEIVALEAGRPHAEIHMRSEFSTSYDDTIYKVADVPEWYIAMRWADQKAFMKDGSLLSTLLDFEGVARKVTAGSGTVGSNKEVDTKPTVLLYNVPSGFNDAGRAQLKYKTSASSSSMTTAYSPMYAWYYKDTSLLSTAESVVDEIGTGAFTTKATTKNGKFVLNTSKTATKNANLVYVANLDAYGYAQTAIAAWTSVWQITDDNPTNDFLPGSDWVSKLPSDVAGSVNTAVSSIPGAKRGNSATSGSTAEGEDTYVIGNPDAESKTVTALKLNYSKNSLPPKPGTLFDSMILGSYNINQGGKVLDKSGTTSAYSKWYSDNTVYTLKTKFSHFNVGEQPGIPTFIPESHVVENNDPDTPTDTSDAIGGYGHYTRDTSSEFFKIYPLVRRGYYKKLDTEPSATFTVGQKSRTLNSHVYYYMGITGTANPTVVANSLGSGSKAQALSASANGVPVALSGTGLTVSYDPNVSLVFQSFNLANIDAEEGYQSGWGNVVNSETAHMEWLHSMGATEYTASAGGSSVTTLGIPYVAGVDCYINGKASAWQLTQDGAKVALKDDNSAGTQEFTISLRVEKGQLTEVSLPETIIAPADGSTAIAAGKYKGTSTKATLAKCPSYLANALRGVGITGDADCILKQTFVTNDGTVMLKDANGNAVTTVAAEGSNWYNEYCYCVGLKFASTVFNMQPLIFTDKIPIELGPKTPANRNDYYNDGYGFMAQSLMLKVGTTPDPTQSSITPEETGVADLMNEVWMISRDKLQYDLVISNVPVTGANN